MTWGRVALPLLVVAALLVAATAWARPGGGGGFSGGSGGGGGGGGGGDDIDILALIELIIWIIQLTVEYPKVMLPLIAIGVIALWWTSRSARGKSDWSSRSASSSAPSRPPVERADNRAVARGFDAVAERDPDFSRIVFEDFLYALFAEAHAARTPKRAAELAAFVGRDARAALDRLHAGATEVGEMVIGSMSLSEPRLGRQRDADGNGSEWITVEAHFEVNYTERREGGAQGFWALEDWTLRRLATARSRPPEQARVFQCPSCGASLSGMQGSYCGHCGQVVDSGRFDWVVTQIRPGAREPRGPILTADVAEQGTDRPTLIDGDLEASLAALGKRDPAFSRSAFEARLRLIFGEMQVAWSTREWKRARPFVSDALFQMQLGWIEAYRRAGLRNVTEGARVTVIELVKCRRDRWFDILTVRLFATSLDYTLTDGGELRAGSRDRQRAYSEYWTLMRGAKVSGAARSDKACPNCGAPLDINMAGNCAYCQSRVTCGEFDWVLSRIEQDEVYAG